MLNHKKKSISILLLLLFTAAIIGGCAAPASTEIAVQTAAVQKQALQTDISLSGVLLPQNSVTLSSKMMGEAVTVNYEVGAAVKKGDTLLTLDTRQLNAQLAQAQAALKQANSAVKSGKSTASSASSAVKVAQGQANTAKINYDAAKSAYDSVKAAYDLGLATQADLEKATVALQVAQSQYNTANSGGVNQAKHSSSSASNNVDTLKAAVEVAEANANLILVQIQNANITSPVDGIVVSRNINPGELAVAGGQLMTVMESGSLKLKGTVSQSALPLLTVGQDIKVSVDIYTGKTYEGKISMIAPMAVATGEYFPIEVTIPAAEGLKPGLSAHTVIEVKSSEHLSIPASAVVKENDQRFVYLFENGLAKKMAVTTGLSNGTYTEILEGLSEGQEVILTQTGILKDSMPVRKL